MIENPSPEFMEQVAAQQQAAMARGGGQGQPRSIGFGATPSVLPPTPDGSAPPTGGVPSVLPPTGQRLRNPTIPTIAGAGLSTVGRSPVSDVPTIAPSVLPGGGQPMPATEVSPMAPRLPMTGGVRGLESVMRQPSVVPGTQPSVMRQIAGTGRMQGLTGVPPMLRSPSLRARPNVANFAVPRRRQGPGIRLTGMKLF